MVVQDRDHWMDRISVPGEVRKVPRSRKPEPTTWRLMLVVFLVLGLFYLMQSHDGFGWFADRVTTLLNELSHSERLIYEQIVGYRADPKVGLPVYKAFQSLQEGLNVFWREVSSRINLKVGDIPKHLEAVRHDLLVKGAILVLVVLICIGFGLVLLSALTGSIRQLDESIRRLGTGDFAKPIRVNGPKTLRYLGDRLECLRARLLCREKSKQQFMHEVSNEFEMPLSNISENIDVLMAQPTGALNPKQHELVARLSQNVQKLQKLLDDSLHYDQVRDNPSPQPKNSINMETLLTSVIENYQDSLKAKSLTIKELVQPVEFFGVPDQVRTIVDNLLSNAIQFSPEGGKVLIILRTVGTGLLLEIEDDGPGIDATEHLRIFEPFFQGKAAQTIDTEGAGLGLAIVSECVANHQGKIESIDPRQDEHGARIRVELPLVEAL